MSQLQRPPKRHATPHRGAKLIKIDVEKALRQVSERPNDPEAWQQLGAVQRRLGRLQEAHDAYQRAIALAPNDAHHHLELGKLEIRIGNFAAAEQALVRSLGCQASAEGHRLLSHVYDTQGHKARARAEAEQALAMSPDDAACLSTLAASLASGFELESARELYHRAARQDPSSYLPYNNLGGVESQLGHLDAAITAYRKAHKIEPEAPLPFSNLITTLHYHPAYQQSQILALARQWSERFSASTPLTADTPRTPDRALRIGMLSDGFRGHPVARMITAALEKVDKTNLTFTLYSTSLEADSYTRRLKALATDWVEVKHLGNEAFAQRVRDDRIDILFDLAGHNAGTRMQAMTMKPAPLIVKWVGGLINTTGVEAIDYLLSDAIETPPGCDDDYVEKLIRLPDDYICYEAPPYTPEVNALPAKANGYITLGCFNNGTKLNDVLLTEWASLMKQLPESRLLLKSQQFKGAERGASITAFMAEQGISEERIMIEGPSPHGELLKTYHRVDIALDPWPYSGGLTTCEAFTMGVPVVSLPGPTFAGRHSATHLINAGMPELVVSSWDEYRERVIELASDLDSLATIRRHLREVLLGSPVCDAKRFARHFTNAVRAIWQRHCEHKAPAALTLDKQGKATFEGDSAPVEIVPVEPLDKATTDDGFRWNFEGRIIVVDNGARLLKTPNPRAFLDLDAFGVVAFDPASQVKKPEFLKTRDDVDLFAHACLGDGTPGELHATLDAKYSSLLAPESAARLHETHAKPMQCLTRLPISTIALDSIEGLPTIDWLALDLSGDTMAILEHGEKALQDALLLQIQVPFQPLYKGQPDFAQISHWAHRHGFRFRQFLNPQHGERREPDVVSSEWVTADALFVPSQLRMERLTANQRAKLAFTLSTVFQAKDAAIDAIASEQRDCLTQSLREPTRELLRQDTQDASALDSAWRHTALQMIATNARHRARPHGLKGRLIISLTSYPARYPTLALTLTSLLQQSITPDHLILWVAHHDLELLPDNVKGLRHQGLEIRTCEDLRSYKKIVPALEAFPDAFIAIADDDAYYWPSWLEELVDHLDVGRRVIPAHRTRLISTQPDGSLAPYDKWAWQGGDNRGGDAGVFATGLGGVLYPPGSLHSDATQQRWFSELCPHGDDIWLYWMARLNGYCFASTGHANEIITWPGSQDCALYHQNLDGGNDHQIHAMVEHYGFPK